MSAKQNYLTLDAQLFKSYFDQYFDDIRHYLYYKSGDMELATDLAQDVFLKIWQKRKQLDTTHIKSLLYKIAKDNWVSHIRKVVTEQKYLEKIPLQYTTDAPTEQDKDLKRAYEKGLTQLSEKQRTAFLMNRLDGLTYKEISTRLQISSKAVEKRIQKALAIFRSCLNQHKK